MELFCAQSDLGIFSLISHALGILPLLISVNKAGMGTAGKGASLEAFYGNIGSKKQKPPVSGNC